MRLARPVLIAAATFSGVPGPAAGDTSVLAPVADAAELHLFTSSVPPSHFFSSTDSGDSSGQGSYRIFDPARISPLLSDGAELKNFRIDRRLVGLALPTSPRRGASPRLFTTDTTLVSAGVLVAGSLDALTSPWDYGFQSYHFHNEGFFGKNTYAGGADKVSHFVINASVARELALIFDRQGHSVEQSTALAFGLTALVGVIVESGDALSVYGFSYEDLTADVLGAATGLFLTRKGLNDLVGLRGGRVSRDFPLPEGHTPSLGANYSGEIYSVDLKLAGLARRLNVRPGVARFLLVSSTYDTKGYGYSPALPLADRQRNVGIEIGLNLPEMLTAVGIRETTWWGNLLHMILNFYRLPYTSFGFHYDLNHGRWHGPDTGNKFN